MTAPSAELVDRILRDLSIDSLRAAFKAEEARLAAIPRQPWAKAGRPYFYSGGSYAMGDRDQILRQVDVFNEVSAVSARRRVLESNGIFARVICYDEPLFCHAFTYVEYDDQGRRVLKGD